MLRRTLQAASPALVVSIVALVLALGGGAYAAVAPGGRAHAAKSNTGPRGPRGYRGFPGPQGPRGGQGVPGTPGPAGLVGVVYVQGTDANVVTQTQNLIPATATCPAGTTVVGGGVTIHAGWNKASVNTSRPFHNADGSSGWSVYVDNYDGVDHLIRADAICATATSVSGSVIKP